MSLVFAWIASPVGLLKLVGSDEGLAAVLWEKDDPRRVRLGPATERSNHPVIVLAGRQLAEYFSRQRKAFQVPLAFLGTEFQQSVWRALLTILYGETRTYGEVARQIGHPRGVRAVGAADGRNPIAIIAPCHRVIGASGSLTGFAGGLAAKRSLLNLETPDWQQALSGGVSKSSPRVQS